MSLKNRLLFLMPVDSINNFDEYVKLNNTTVALLVGKVNPQQTGLKRKDLPPQPGLDLTPSRARMGLSMLTRIKLTEKLGIISKLIRDGEPDIVGELSPRGLGLGVKLDTNTAF